MLSNAQNSSPVRNLPIGSHSFVARHYLIANPDLWKQVPETEAAVHFETQGRAQRRPHLLPFVPSFYKELYLAEKDGWTDKRIEEHWRASFGKNFGSLHDVLFSFRFRAPNWLGCFTPETYISGNLLADTVKNGAQALVHFVTIGVERQFAISEDLKFEPLFMRTLLKIPADVTDSDLYKYWVENKLCGYIRNKEFPPNRGAMVRRDKSAAHSGFAGNVRDLPALEVDHADELKESGLFDENYYLARYPDVAESDIDAFYHFHRFGYREGRWPNPYFDTAWYLAKNPGVEASGQQPLLHFLLEGDRQGFHCSELFDVGWYRDQYQIPAAQNTLAHYLRFRFERQLSPHPDFDTKFYAQRHPDAVADGVDLFDHVLNYGREELSLSNANPQHVAPPQGPYLGCFDRLENGLAEGWAYHPARPETTTRLRVLIGGKETATITGNLARPDVRCTGHPTGDTGFEYEIPARYRDGAPHSIEILFPNGAPVHFQAGGQIRFSRIFTLDQIIYAQGTIDFVANGVVRGWALRADTRGGPLTGECEIEITSNGVFVARAIANRHRPDVSEALKCRPNCGFHILIPIAFRKSQFRDFRCFVLPTRVELGNSPCPVSNPQGECDANRQELYDSQVYELADVIRDHFDSNYYIEQMPSAAESGIDLVQHYLAIGEKMGLNPRPGFDVNYYLDTNIDLKNAGISPFGHYIRHGRAEHRSPSPYHLTLLRHEPLVSVIVPNYNHARFLAQRIGSIRAQSYRNFELIFLDDCSTDGSIEVVEAINAQSPVKFQTHYNEMNSGNVFAQWQKGISLAKGELVWICESDDFCEPDFLMHLVAHFRDRSVMLAFGRIQFCDAEGQFMDGLDNYREGAWPGMWTAAFKRPAKEWFFECMGVKNVIANVGGCIFRRQELPDEVWKEAKTYRIAGDWFLYSELAGGGCITYDPSAVAYFRQHGANASASNFRQPYYYREHAAILRHLVKMWGLPARTRQRLIEKIRSEYDYLGMADTGYAFEDLIPVAELMALTKQRRHLQFGSLGFFVGGGEAFPINVANLFIQAGDIVSMVCFNLHDQNPEIAGNLNRRIAVYDSTDVIIHGQHVYLDRCGIDLVNSHSVQIDHQFFLQKPEGPLPVPYVCTLHGSHDVMDLASSAAKRLLETLANDAAGWIYTADKNLLTFTAFDLPPNRLFKVNNAMPLDERPFPKTRSQLGIDEDTVVFTLVARGIERKGWRASVIAFRQLLRARPAAKIHLLLVGAGEKADASMQLVGAGEPVTHLGFQANINGLYRISDCAIIPTRFPGESNPLCLIQAIQEGLPVIATDVGEIRKMLTLDGEICGLLLDVKRDTNEFATDLQRAMARVLDTVLRAQLAAQSRRLAPKFDLRQMVDEYEAVFEYARDGVSSKTGMADNLAAD